MSIEQILNALGLSAILFYFFIPLIIVCLAVYGVRAAKRNNKIKLERAKIVKEQQAKAKEDLKNNGQSNTTATYKSESLAIEFDESGEIKK